MLVGSIWDWRGTGGIVFEDQGLISMCNRVWYLVVPVNEGVDIESQGNCSGFITVEDDCSDDILILKWTAYQY